MRYVSLNEKRENSVGARRERERNYSNVRRAITQLKSRIRISLEFIGHATNFPCASLRIESRIETTEKKEQSGERREKQMRGYETRAGRERKEKTKRGKKKENPQTSGRKGGVTKPVAISCEQSQ